VKSEYTHEIPTEEESDLALSLAKEVIRVYDMVEKEMGI
jgi:hypothetical protein